MKNKINFASSDPILADIDFHSLAVSDDRTEDDFSFTAAIYPFVPIETPEFSYLAITSKISMSTIPSGNLVNQITDGFQTVSFRSGLQKRLPNQINNWGVPPYAEDPKPEALISPATPLSITWTLSRPSKVFGFELMPNLFGTFTYKVDFYKGKILAGSITRTITVPGPPIGPAFQGARLFAAITDGPGFDRIVITSKNGNTLSFLVSQVRYQMPC